MVISVEITNSAAHKSVFLFFACLHKPVENDLQ